MTGLFKSFKRTKSKTNRVGFFVTYHKTVEKFIMLDKASRRLSWSWKQHLHYVSSLPQKYMMTTGEQMNAWWLKLQFSPSTNFHIVRQGMNRCYLFVCSQYQLAVGEIHIPSFGFRFEISYPLLANRQINLTFIAFKWEEIVVFSPGLIWI